MSELPPSWAAVPFSAITVDVLQRVPLAEEVIRYIDIGSVNRNTKLIESPQELLGKDAPSRARKQVAVGDTLVSMTRPNLNAVALVPKELDGQIASTGFDVLRPVASVDSRWIGYLVRSEAFVEAMSDLVQGALYPAVRSKDVRAHVVPLAPQSEQTRIANQLDTLLARVQACNDRFDAIPALLKRFRQTIYMAAISGTLTEDWRAANNLSDWTHERAADVCAKVQSGGTPKEGFSERGVPFLKVYNIVNQKVAFDYKPQYIESSIHHGSMAKSRIQPGDVLMNIVGPPLGKVAVVPANRDEWNINQAITLFRPSDRISTGWLYCILCSGVNIADIIHETRGSAGQTNISLSQCRDFVFPVPPVAEQTEIVRRVEALFALADRIEISCTAARAQAQRLTPLVLAKAFRGELVPQDPNDEPASALLARLSAQHGHAAGPVKIRQIPQPRAATAIKESTTMTKSRQDDDVRGKPYLSDHLRRIGTPATAETLFNVAELPVADFYKQLAWEVAQGLVKDSQKSLEPRNAA
jgi:type I restriction enzyme, S subunit